MRSLANARLMSGSSFLVLKKYLYTLFILVLASPFIALYRSEGSAYPDWWAFHPQFVLFILFPVFDHIFGEDRQNPTDREVNELSSQSWYRFLTLLALPLQLAMIFAAAGVFARDQFGLLGQLGWMGSVGTCSAIVGITAAHELVHKDSRLEQWAGGILLASVTYAGFKVEHIRGHHVHVSTPGDASSARYNQSLYSYLPHAYKWNFINAWKLEAERLRRLGHSPLHWRNELIWWYALSLVFATILGLMFGIAGVVFFIGQSFFAATTLEIINYIEHYGLHRRKLNNGCYERINVKHSWNSNYFVSNMLLFQLQRHSDHHAHPKRRYQALQHFNESPQLPSGYGAMVMLALVPPLWRKVMNPRVEAYYRGEQWQLDEGQGSGR